MGNALHTDDPDFSINFVQNPVVTDAPPKKPRQEPLSALTSPPNGSFCKVSSALTTRERSGSARVRNALLARRSKRSSYTISPA